MLPDLIWGLSLSSPLPWQSFSLLCCRDVVYFAVPRPFHWLPADETPTATLPSQPMARHFQPVTQKYLVPMSQAWQKVGWEDGTTPGGRGHERWSRRSATLTLGPLSSLSLTQIHPSSLQTLTHTVTSQLGVQISSVPFSVCGWLEINCKLARQ